MQQDDVLNLIRRSGRALHGKRWQVPLSRDLGVTDRTLRYWLNSTNAVSVDDVLSKLLNILLAHEQQLREVVDDIRTRMAQRP